MCNSDPNAVLTSCLLKWSINQITNPNPVHSPLLRARIRFNIIIPFMLKTSKLTFPLNVLEKQNAERISHHVQAFVFGTIVNEEEKLLIFCLLFDDFINI
jgi:hypothetical protein